MIFKTSKGRNTCTKNDQSQKMHISCSYNCSFDCRSNNSPCCWIWDNYWLIGSFLGKIALTNLKSHTVDSTIIILSLVYSFAHLNYRLVFKII